MESSLTSSDEDPVARWRKLKRRIVNPPYVINESDIHPVIVPTPLCEFCQTIADKSSRESQGERSAEFEHHNNLTALQASAKGGCELCAHFIIGFIDLEVHNEYNVAMDETKNRELRRGIVSVDQTYALGPFPSHSLRARLLYLKLHISYATGDLDTISDKSNQKKPLKFLFTVFLISNTTGEFPSQIT